MAEEKEAKTCPTCGRRLIKARTEDITVDQAPDAHPKSYEFSICHGCGWNDLTSMLHGS